jgi:hypothetical protein
MSDETQKLVEELAEVRAMLAAVTIALVATLQKLGWSTEKINNDELLQHVHDLLKKASAQVEP